MSKSRAKPIGPFELGGRGGTVVLERCDEAYGHVARSIDDCKGTFAFTFKVKVRRGEEAFRYLLGVFDLRAHLDWRFSRLPTPSETLDPRIYHAPFDAELTAPELDSITLRVERFARESTLGSPGFQQRRSGASPRRLSNRKLRVQVERKMGAP